MREPTFMYAMPMGERDGLKRIFFEVRALLTSACPPSASDKPLSTGDVAGGTPDDQHGGVPAAIGAAA
jgi:hypothetical protein